MADKHDPILWVGLTITECPDTGCGGPDYVSYTVKAAMQGELGVEARLDRGQITAARSAKQLQAVLKEQIARQIAEDLTAKIMVRLARIGAV